MNLAFSFALDQGSFGLGNVLTLLLGLALFLYGMDVMGDALKRCAGNSLKSILAKMTSNTFKGFLLGLGVTLVIQSSSAVTVMVVGFVNSGTMTLLQSVGIIFGANVGTAITAWLTALSTIEAASGAVDIFRLLNPNSWMPIVAIIGICLLMFVKRGRKKDIGFILLGFAVLMVGMSTMSNAVKDLGDNDTFKNALTMFTNPILGILMGAVFTAIVQSSSASVGILQALTTTGAISYGAAIPIVMGQNIGTCITAMISALGANKNGRRTAVIHLSFNVIAVAIVSVIFYTVTLIFKNTFDPLLSQATNAWGIAIIHTVFKIIAVAILGPFNKLLVKLSRLIIKDTKDEQDRATLLDDRLLATPSVATERATQVVQSMAAISIKSLHDSLSLFESFDPKVADDIRDTEDKVDTLEDSIGSYLIKISENTNDKYDTEQVTKLLHIIGDLERISDHAVNIVESCEEIRDKKIAFSQEAERELTVFRSVITELLNLSYSAFVDNDLEKAREIEPLEQVSDDLRYRIKLNHIIRLQKSECTIEHGFVLSDILTNFERVADHCSNIGGCMIEISDYDALNMHEYNASVKKTSDAYMEKYKAYSEKYSI